MMKSGILNWALCVLLASVSFADEKDGWSFEIDSEGQPRIRFQIGKLRVFSPDVDRVGQYDLSGLEIALGKYRESGSSKPLESLPFFDYFHHPKLQDELFAQFEKDHPELLAAALGSSGNMHNPKVLPLYGKFEETLRKTPIMVEIEQLLSEVDHSIDNISFEKFWIDKKGEKPRFFSIVWIQLKAET